MSTLPQVLNFENTELQTVIRDGELFSSATKLATALGYANPRDAINRHVEECDIFKFEVASVSQNNKARKYQIINFVNESGMYALILGSKKPEAKRFKHWITSEVLPAIRKTGSYSTTNNKTALEALDMITPEVCYNLNMSKATWLGGIKAMAGVESLEDLTSEQIAEVIAHALIQVVDKIKEDNKPISADFEQIDYLPGHMRLVCEPSASLHEMMKKVASCYLDSDAAFRNIMMQLEKDCKLHNLSWINYERLGTALRSLANFSDEAFKHKKMLAQIDSNAITSMAVSYGLPAVCYNKAV